MSRPRRVQDLPLRVVRSQHELVLPGRLLQEALGQHGARCRAYQRGEVRQRGGGVVACAFALRL